MSSRQVTVVVAAVWMCAALVHSQAAQAPKTDPPARTTLDGVYTAEQADRGQKLYGMSCLGGCHNAASHKGATFKSNWSGHHLADLFETIHDRMPDDNPGLLSEKESADVVGYLLKINGMPAGKDELGTDKVVLAKIRIEAPPGLGGAEHRR